MPSGTTARVLGLAYARMTGRAGEPLIRRLRHVAALALLASLCLPAVAHAHGVDDADRAFLEQIARPHPVRLARHQAHGHRLRTPLFLMWCLLPRPAARHVDLLRTPRWNTAPRSPVGGLTGTNVNSCVIDATLAFPSSTGASTNSHCSSGDWVPARHSPTVFVFRSFHGLDSRLHLEVLAFAGPA